MNFKEAAQQTENYIIRNRRYLHEHPELSEKEEKTTEYIVKELKDLGLEPRRFENCYGCYVDIKGDKPGKIVALRADIDALPIKEETGLEFASQNGCMHACGHDTHMAMLLGAVKMLNDVKYEINGTVRAIFQPSEETATGAQAVIKEGVLEGVSAIYGSHIWGNFDAPLVSVESGKRMASCSSFKIEIEGRTAHGSAPNLGVDAIVVAASVIMNLQTYVSRNNDPLNPLVLTIGTIEGGSRFNVIPGKVTMEGTVRAFDSDLDRIPNAMRRIIDGTAETFGAKAKLDFKWMTIPVINDNEKLNTIAQNAVKKLYGEDGLGHLDTMMGSEDFSFYMGKVPGVFSFLGSRDTEKGYIYTNHQEQYTVDEGLLKRGAAVYAQFAFDYLEENK
mgnify:FL=1